MLQSSSSLSGENGRGLLEQRERVSAAQTDKHPEQQLETANQLLSKNEQMLLKLGGKTRIFSWIYS
ncbi:hypothetical protein INR49_016086 [Caranx melampygus]|nr:hypothetical protein INR49_016086 [Caranx melampygus]